MSSMKETYTFDHLLIDDGLRMGMAIAHFLSELLEEAANKPAASKPFRIPIISIQIENSERQDYIEISYMKFSNYEEDCANFVWVAVGGLSQNSRSTIIELHLLHEPHLPEGRPKPASIKDATKIINVEDRKLAAQKILQWFTSNGNEHDIDK